MALKKKGFKDFEFEEGLDKVKITCGDHYTRFLIAKAIRFTIIGLPPDRVLKAFIQMRLQPSQTF